MRNKFFELLIAKMAEDKSLFLIVADMGLGVVEVFEKSFPDRFLNVGIAEQNMIGVAAGLCNIGYKPICYTISNFLTQRCLEQIRNDICLHKYPITLVGTSTGFDNAILGATHYPIDDIGCIKTLLGMSIYSPSTIKSVEKCFDDIITSNMPAYIRIGKGSQDITHVDGCNYYAVKQENYDTLLITHGNTLSYCLEAVNNSANVSVLCVNKLKPFDNKILSEILELYSKVIVVEEQLSSCGLYNILCQAIMDEGLSSIKIKNISPDDQYPMNIGDKDFFADKYGFSASKLMEYIKQK